MFPPIEPFATGRLRTRDGHEIHWETSGNPRGKPALYLHGGPGAGLMTGHRRRFDPERWLVVALDQRGCGRSTPLVIDALDTLATNTTDALIADIEALREHLGIDAWLVYGVSWGTTLALAYAQAHPARVTELVLMCVVQTSASEVAWITEDLRRVFPREWSRFEAASKRRSGQRVIDAYHALITSADATEREEAARAWCAWEDTHVSLDPRHRPEPRFETDAVFRQTFATLTIHYWKHAAFLEDGALLSRIDRIAHIPAALIHGRLDISSPLEWPWQLHLAWPKSTLTIVDDEGHGGDTMIDEVVRAIARFAP
ncbi:prolyl aminopeptidase [Sandaracinus amylolyticus]|uniref:Proline iminopeptidase n=1 Tax=Sandaracinus amylolyticus TaxID=927083 RepID=A0A0F6YHP6_9BACT|nr:prolyl aminopeptidase [Sandaracinus amylolyticus]AKF06016.1 Proline iminopeptidase [Sandaracinus amylolyticus]